VKIKGLNQGQNRRISFMSSDSNPFVNESPDGGRTNLHKNYEDLFSKNAITEESPRKGTEQAEQEFRSPLKLLDSERFDYLIGEIDKLSKDNQDIVLQKLLKMRQNSGPELHK